jgi:hypothetical protein
VPVFFRRSELVAWMDRHREKTPAADLDRIVDDAVASVLGQKERTVRRSRPESH